MKNLSLLAKNIEQRKQQLGIRSGIDLARKSGVSRAVLTNIKKNPQKSIMVDSAIDLAEALECRLEWLITGKGHPTSDEYLEVERVANGAPLIWMNELKDKSAADLLEAISKDKFRRRFLCPVGNAATQFVLVASSDVGKYPAGGHIYFDTTKKPVSNDIVIVKQGNNIDLFEYQAILDREFLKSLNTAIPEDFRLFEIADHELIATASACIIF